MGLNLSSKRNNSRRMGRRDDGVVSLRGVGVIGIFIWRISRRSLVALDIKNLVCPCFNLDRNWIYLLIYSYYKETKGVGKKRREICDN